ncbi:rho GTPase-activating protein 7 isoform X1 [Erpetoichthys calabaricus]|uniref:rho GTPase-activating protein 7 isoform X1 n=1 Tax=Erpetoichthys calabaricus TaxID=27687 RepID=UPI0010A02562|nr:rho GTPase-activating protein 7 isoform X1 [Erpetoichthys calabaricus]
MANSGKLPLRRSFSEHIKDSTNKAWDMFWKSTREKRLSEIEAKEACDWLRAAGFPQYSQLFEDSQFPINIDLVKTDHAFLDRDAIDSLCRRLNTLNKCVEMKLEIGRQRRKSDESEDEDPCAISTKWTFERHSRRWSRLDGLDFSQADDFFTGVSPESSCLKNADSEDAAFSDSGEKHEVCSLHSSSSTDSDGLSVPKASEDLENSRSSSRNSSIKATSPNTSFSGPPSPNDLLVSGGEDKVCDKPVKKRGKSLLKKMEKLRMRSSSLRRPSHVKGRLLISGPVLQEGFDEEKLKRFNCVDISELQDDSRGNFSFPPSCSSSSPSESSSVVSTPSPEIRIRSLGKRVGINKEAMADSLSNGNEQSYESEKLIQDKLMFQVPHGHKPGTFPKALTHNVLSPIDNTSVNWRTGSFHGYRGGRSRTNALKDHEPVSSPLATVDNRISIYDNVPGVHVHHTKTELPAGIEDDDVFSELDDVMERINGLQQLVSQWTEKMSDDGDSDFANDSTSPCPSSPNEIHLEINQHLENDHIGSEMDVDNLDKSSLELGSAELDFLRDSGVGSSLTHPNRQQKLHWLSEQSLHGETSGLSIDSQTAAQLNLLQKLALLKLTALMDRYSPSSKQGWNWTVPKFIRKVKAPDYKDKYVFGVPLLLNAQRTGSALPPSIQKAMTYLQSHCLDQVGLFRKSGVKSRIQYLRENSEMDPDNMSYEGQSAFDVADMLKQYFRDLPEPIFTSKLCDSFLHIYQYLPKDQQFSAIQAAILLLPDENREALQTLLYFLSDVVACVEENQMTPTNIAVCLAPSLFHLNSLRKDSTNTLRSSQRKYSLGRPDQRDLTENLAATQGLAHMISEATRLFQLPKYWLFQHVNSLTEEAEHCGSSSSESECSRRAYLEVSVQTMLREAREKYKCWVTCTSLEQVDLAFKKVDDGNPLRLWKSSTEVDASQEEVFHRILREQKLWDPNLQSSKVIETLDKETEIFHYSSKGSVPYLPRDHVILRCWQSDPQSGAYILAATSTDHEDAPCNGVRGDVLMCHYLIESIGLCKSRLTHFCRTDLRGKMPEWYNKVFGYQVAAKVARIRDSFKPEIKETKI